MTNRFEGVEDTDLTPDEEQSILNLARRVMYQNVSGRDILTSSTQTRHFLRVSLAGLEHEVFGVLYLNQRNHLIANEHMFRGTVNGAAVYPREVVKAVLGHNATSVIFYHNHPSGNPEPSKADIAITRKLKAALETIEVSVLDHLIVGEGADYVVSMAERSLI